MWRIFTYNLLISDIIILIVVFYKALILLILLFLFFEYLLYKFYLISLKNIAFYYRNTYFLHKAWTFVFKNDNLKF